VPLDQLLPLIALAFAGSFTPGPNNTIAAVTGVNHGLRAALPHVLGVPFGFSTMLVAGATGVAAVLLARPRIAQAIEWAGIAYLLFISWQIARAGSLGDRSLVRPLSFWQSVAFQYANPKGWMLAVATATSFMASRPTWIAIAIIVAVWAIAAVASLVAWASAGAALRGWLAVSRRLRRFNLAMGALLAATALWLALS
jgi:threonine/homoserine/homoserine lactone efflux protein